MIIEAFISMIFLGIRIVFAKYCARIISALTFNKFNFFAEIFCFLTVVLLSCIKLINFDLNLLIRPNVVLTNIPAGICMVFAEILAAQALSRGITGPAVALISFNGIIVSVLTWAINGLALRMLQIVGIGVAFLGVLIVSFKSETSSKKISSHPNF